MKNVVVAFLLVIFLQPSNHCFAQRSATGLRNTIETFRKMLEQDVDLNKNAKIVFDSEHSASLLAEVKKLREFTRGNPVADVMIQNGTGTFVYQTQDGEATIRFEYVTEPKARITSVSSSFDTDEALKSPLTWDNVESELDKAAEDGFNGCVLITRNNKIVIHKAFGLANREKNIPNRPDTVFAIGSAPIDFTHASILTLRDEGKIRLQDKITKYFDQVPNDKKSITIRHLMTGRSGLPDFHDLPTDKEPDHSWIDREEAVRRIMNQELLFKPGAGNEHSHSAWGLLAAIVEIASGKTYAEFTRERLYRPAGMKDTGFFGDAVDEKKVAVGYGYRKSSDPNSPPNWGKTSWLVMGSGGQISTLMDLYRWEVAIREGKILSPKSTKEFIGKGNRVSADGDMYGFEFLHSHDPQSMFMLISNTIASRDERKRFDELGRRLHDLTNRRDLQSNYRIGIAMGYDQQEDRTSVRQVVANSAAADAGILVGDVLLSANGIAFGHPNDVLAKPLKTGEEIKLILMRNDKKLTVKLKPRKTN